MTERIYLYGMRLRGFSPGCQPMVGLLGRVMDWCDVCKYNPPDYSSHEPDKPCGDCWVFGEGNEPSKFVETENRQTNADLIRQRSDEELAEYFSDIAGWLSEYEGKAHALLKWLKAPAEEVEG